MGWGRNSFNSPSVSRLISVECWAGTPVAALAETMEEAGLWPREGTAHRVLAMLQQLAVKIPQTCPQATLID